VVDITEYHPSQYHAVTCHTSIRASPVASHQPSFPSVTPSRASPLSQHPDEIPAGQAAGPMATTFFFCSFY
jgi:hypothetical protein